MSNYTKTTNFASKDNLSPGNPLKIVKGTEIDTEFNNIQTAVATKTDNSAANITGGSITGITDLAVADGGTGASTATAALNNLLPTQTGNANKYLQTDGTNATWDAVSLSTADITGTLPVANGGTGVTSSTGTGSVVLSNSPTLVTPALGTPASGTATNLTGLPISTGVSGLGTGVATFLGTPSSANLASAVTDETGSGALVFANSPTLVTPALGTPSALVGTNITGTASGLTAGNVTTNANLTGAVTSVGNATSLGSFSSANLLAALTDETGTGSAVFATSPTLVTPILGTPTSATLTNATGLPISTGVSGLGTGVATALAVNVGSSGAPLVNGGVLGTPSSGTATNLTGLPLTTGVTGTLPTANGGTNLTSFTSGGVVYASSTSALATGSNLYFDGTNLGVGVTSPSQKLELAGVLRVKNGNADTNGLNLSSDAAGVSTINSGYAGAGVLRFLTSDDEKMRITNAGNVGIGTSSPQRKLSIANGGPVVEIDPAGGTAGPIYFNYNRSTATYLTPEYWALAHIWNVSGGTEAMRLTSTGLGIGTSTATAKLTVINTADANKQIVFSDNATYYGSVGHNSGTGLNEYRTEPSGGHGFFIGTSGTANMMLNSSGNLGIGTSSPAYKLDVAGVINATVSGGGTPLSISSGSFCGFSITGSGSDQFISFNDGATNRAVMGVDFSNANAFVINSGGGSFGTQFVLDTAGRLSLGSTLGIGGATPSTSGSGITFPATQSASSDANTLDDYEEGTWTPSLGGTATYTTQSGQYTKVGRLVNIRCNLQVNLIGTGSAFQISGLPFTSATNNGNPTAMVVVGNFQSLALSVIEISAFVGASGTTMNMTGLTAAGASTSTGFSVFGNSARVDLTVTYFTD